MQYQTNHKIIIGDSRKLNKIEDESVQLIVTSPPYWQLKDYGSDNQIGYNQNYQNYINNLNLVWNECYRILEKGCRLCINIGDQFARSVYYGRYKVIPIQSEIIKFCEAIGFDFMGDIIWQKKTTMNTTGGASLMGSYPTPRNGIITIDYEHILIFKKLGNARKPSKEIKEASKLTKDEWKTYFNGHWYFSGVKQNGHIAMFPEELPKRLIKMFSFINDTIFDPFLGSGTTSLAAKNLGRNSIGYELNKDFLPIIEKKLNIKQDLFCQYEIIEDIVKFDYQKEIEKLPYKFIDYHNFDKKIDPKKLQFGSKIDNQKSEREEYFSIKEIISPELLRLSNNLIVRLIGIEEKKETFNEAIEFLKKKTEKQKVFLRYDNIKFDTQNNIMAYVYLKNKTFLNAHLIKQKLVNVKFSYEYKYKDKFLKYYKGE